jgi:Zn-dependent protease with chaperone function
MTKNIWQLRFLAFIFPLLMVGVFLFEGNRISGYVRTPEQLAQANAQLQAANAANVQSMRTGLEQTEKYANSRKKYNTTAQTRQAAATLEQQMADMRTRIAEMEKPTPLSEGYISKTLISSLGYLGAVIAFFTSLVGAAVLLKATQWKAVALQSRDALLTAFATSQRLMPRLLTVLLILTAMLVALFATLEILSLFLPVPEYLTRKSNSKLFIFYVMFVGGTGVFALMLAWFTGRVLRQLSSAFQHASEPMLVTGRSVTFAEAPALWSAVTEVAQKLSAPRPKNIIIGMEDGFYVTEHEIKLKPTYALLEGQSLYLSAPRMALLSPEEIMFVIGHELGHFAGDDTAYSRRFSPLYGKALRTNDILSEQKATTARRLNEFVLDTFDLAILQWSRVREFAADQAGKTIAGGVTSASALLRLVTTDPVIEGHYRDLRRNDISANALTRFQASAELIELADPHAELKKDIPHPTDTHPPTQERAKVLAAETLNAAFAAASRPVDDAGFKWLRQVIVGYDALYQTISEGYAKTVKGQVEAYKSELREIITDANVAGATVVFERTSWSWYLLPVLPGVVTLMIVYRWMFPSGTPLSDMSEFLRVASALGVTLVLGGFVWLRHWIRSGKPFLTLTPAGIESKSFQRTLAWTEIVDYSVTETNGNFLNHYAIAIQLSPSIEFGLRDRNRLRFRYKTNKKNLPFTLFLTYQSPLKGIKDEAFLQLFGNYYRAALAKSELDKLENESTIGAQK